MADPIQLAWAAGLFEGEGCASLLKPNQANRTRAYLQLQVTSTDLDVLRRFHRAVGVGNLRGPYRNKPADKPFWRWELTGRDALGLVACDEFVQHLGKRRSARIAEIVSMVKAQPPCRAYNRRRLNKTPEEFAGRG